MKLGVCATPDKLPLLSELGFDYIESNFSWLAGLSEADFKAKTTLLEKYGLPSEAFNGFFPADMRLYAPGEDPSPLLRQISAFCKQAFPRAAAWGGRVAVIGSGYARGIPEGMTLEETNLQFARVLAVCGEVASQHGMRVTVEPLSSNECNYIHTLSQADHAVSLAQHPALGIMVDFYHLWKNRDDPEALPSYGDRLLHAHYARPVNRNAPEEGDAELLAPVAQVLSRCSVPRISLECVWQPDFNTALRRARPLMEIFKDV